MSEFGSNLPPLPNLSELLATARQRRDHFAEVVKAAQVEVDNAERYIQQLGGRGISRAPRGSSRYKSVSVGAYNAVLTALANHKYAAIYTLSADTGISRSQVGQVMIHAVERGHATRERRGRQFRFIIAEAGEEYLTSSPQRTSFVRPVERRAS